MTLCPRCKSEETDTNKSWDVIPKSGKGKAMRVTLYRCRTCGNKYRKAIRIIPPLASQLASPAPINAELMTFKQKAEPLNPAVVSVSSAAHSIGSSSHTVETAPNLPGTLDQLKVIADASVTEISPKLSLLQRLKKTFTG